MKPVMFLAILLALPGTRVAAQDAVGARREAIVEAAREIMVATRYCAVITVDDTGRPQARTVDAFPPERDMTVWFATNPASRKVSEIRRDNRVTLHYFDVKASESGYVTLLGRARLVDDPAEKRKRWKAGWEAYWPDRDAGYLLVEVTPERLEILSPARGIGGDPKTWRPPSIDFHKR